MAFRDRQGSDSFKGEDEKAIHQQKGQYMEKIKKNVSVGQVYTLQCSHSRGAL